MKRFTNTIYKYIQPFHFRSVFFKYLKQFSLISVIPFLVLSMLVYYTQANNSKINSNNALERLSNSVTNTLSHTFLKSEQVAKNLEISAQNYFITSDIGNMYIISQAISDMQHMLAQNETIHSIYMYRFSEKKVLSTKRSSDIGNSEFKPIIKYYEKSKTTNFAVRTTYYDDWSKSNCDLLSFCYGVYSDSICHGIISVNYEFDELDSLVGSGKNDTFCIMDKNDNLLYSNNRSLLDTKLSDIYSYNTASKESVLINEHDYTSITTPLKMYSLRLVSIYDYDEDSNAKFYLRMTLILSIIAAIVLALLLSFYVSYSFYKSLAEIINGFSIIKTDEISENITDEINYITDQTSKLIDKNQNFERELAENMAQLKSLQLTASQLQFNHHFLFNTLNLISVLAHDLAKDENAVSKSIALLSELLRVSLDTDQYTTSISAEIMYAKKYIELEQLKYENIFTVEWDVSPNLNNFRIIKLILQPIIENAFIHALKPMPKDYKKKLRISAQTHGDKIVFHITDNGIGFEPKKLKEIQESLQSSSFNKSKHIGLTNINSRIKLLFGDECGLTIHPLDVGTDIEITIRKMDFGV